MKKAISFVLVVLICFSACITAVMAETDNVQLPDELIYDGGLDKTTSLAHQSSYDNATYENWHIWYRPKSGGWGTEIQEDGTNTVLFLNNSWVCQSVKITANTTYTLRFKAKNASADLNISASLRNLNGFNTNLIDKTSATITAGQDWTEYTVVFEIGELLEGVTDYALGLYRGSNGSVLIDDISFKETKYTITATAEEGGTVSVSKNMAKPGETVAFTATPNTNYEFDGWYSGETQVSSESEYQVTASADISLTAKFVYADVNNLMSGKKPEDWLGRTFAKVSKSNDTRYGGRAYLISDAMHQSISTEITLKPGTTYSYSFQWKSVDNELGLAFVSQSRIFSANSGDRNDDACYDNGTVYKGNGEYKNLIENVNVNNPGDKSENLLDWNTYSATFTTTDDAKYYLSVNFGNNSDKNNHQAIILSDFVITEVVKGVAPEGDSIIEHAGISLRKEGESVNGQAIRYKFIVDEESIKNAQADGYELVEYGAAVAPTTELAGHAADPILNATSYKVRKGIAYQKTFASSEPNTNVVYGVEDDGDVIYTVALYNIPKKNYATDIAVRPYAIFENAEGDTYVRYGTTRVASVFKVAREIYAGNRQDDIDYVNNILLAGDLKNQYDAWVKDEY